ncbi:MAG: SEC-C metal-binding domain-containing protein, partial [Myxococcota bacterium]|nr:SEC-C metal-binding domain-containing protein [Myxococcota bacterium]
MNTQRKTVYELRRKVLGDDPMDEDIMDIVERVLAQTIEATCPKFSAADEWNLEGLKTKVQMVFGASIQSMIDSKKIFEMRPEDILDELFLMMEKRWHDKFKEFEERFAVVKDGLKPKDALEVTDKVVEPVSRFFIRNLYSREIDSFWREHLTHMDHLKEGIHLRGYGQRDPKIEYKREGYQLFEAMMSDIDHNVLTKLYNIELATREEALQIEEQERKRRQAAEALQRAAQLAGSSGNKGSDGLGNDDGPGRAAAPKKVKRPGRNDPCWCGSGKKYKKCHMREDEAKAQAQIQA